MVVCLVYRLTTDRIVCGCCLRWLRLERRAGWIQRNRTQMKCAPERVPEGAVRQVSVNAYERNPRARARCIEAHGTACCVCGIDLGAVRRGEARTVHHLRPFPRSPVSEVDPVHDLRPVCPNCHARSTSERTEDSKRLSRCCSCEARHLRALATLCERTQACSSRQP